MSTRIGLAELRSRVMSAEEAARFIRHGDHVGMSGFTGSGHPKVLPQALARRIRAAHAAGEPFRVGVWTGASTAPDLDGALAEADGIELRLPYQSDPVSRERINAGHMSYVDVHLSHVAQIVWSGFMGGLDVAVIEVAGITADGKLIPTTSIGNNKTWLDLADRVILEVNSHQPLGLAGFHDIYYGTALPPHRVPVPIVAPGDRIGQEFYECDPAKIVAIIETDVHDRNGAFKPVDSVSARIAEHFVDFLQHEVAAGRLPSNLLPLQSGVGNIANAVLSALGDSGLGGLTAYTEVIQDGMLDLIEQGIITLASSTAVSLSPERTEAFLQNLDFYRDKIILRPQEISNHPEVVRRLGVIACNGLIEADIYGNVNSTHIMGSRIQNGIGGSGDFTRNAFLACFVTPSTAKGGALSCIVPMVSHVDHTEHDTHIFVTEQGLADLRGLSPRQRARVIIDKCAHPDYQAMLTDYLDRAEVHAWGKQTPHILAEAFSWHERYMQTGSMLPKAPQE